MIGCWTRRNLRFADGTEDKTTRVIWLQTLSGVCDVRISASRPDLRERRGFADCSTEELLKLAEQDCFCGTTLFDPEAEPFPTASWPKEAYLFRFQPVITFPEPGWLEWRDFGTCMIETAPSGAYVEDWRLLPESRSFAAHLTKRDAVSATCLYVAGEHAIYARNRAVDLPSDKSLVSSPGMLNANAAAWRSSWIANSLMPAANAPATTTRLWLRLCPGEKVRPLAILGSQIWLRTPRASKPWH